MHRIAKYFLPIFLLVTAQNPALGQDNTRPDPLQYADLADLSVNAPLIVHVTVKKAIKVRQERALSAPSGTQRFYVEAETNALIRGQSGIAGAIRYIIDLPLNERGKPPKIKRQQFIIFARPSNRGAGEVQLISKDAQILWGPNREARIKAIVRELVKRDAPPAIDRIASAFHVPGTIIGEGETQIFMDTDSNVPVSISVLSRDGQQKVWAVSLGEIVDEAARAPARNSLLWYRLACFLPRELPYEALDGQSPDNAETARQDYRMVIRDLGSCPRARRI